MVREHTRKPDPEEPWRYVCPDCGRQVYGRSNSMGYACYKHCGTYRKSDLVDRNQRDQ